MRLEEQFDDNGEMTITIDEFKQLSVGMMKFWIGVASIGWFIVLLLVIIVMLVVL